MQDISANDTPLPFDRYRGRVDPAWIDYNGHMNVAYYLLAFDQATDAFFDHLGLGVAYSDSGKGTTFAGQITISYLSELKLDDPLRVTTQLLAYDEKRLRYYHRMFHAEDDSLAATSEMLSLHIDLRVRRVGPFPQTIQNNLARLWNAHKEIAPPEDAGQGIARPPLAGFAEGNP